jgi:molybdopterin synthase catalytic subunit
MTTSIGTALSDVSIDVADAIARVDSPEVGGIGAFVGTVRASPAVGGNENKSVVALEYEAHTRLAETRLRDIAEEAARKWDLVAINVVHRTGHCDLGEPTVVVACASAHRGPALDSCHWIIDELKQTVPIWKKEMYSDGSSWVGAEGSDGSRA